MCGIWGYISKKYGTVSNEIRSQLFTAFNEIRKRGPDRSDFKIMNEFVEVFLGFHRLAIMDKSSSGDQPFVFEVKSTNTLGLTSDRTVLALCNGEIYNFHDLVKKYNLQLKSKSDCEVIPLLYRDFDDFDKVVNELVGEFACVVVDIDHSNDKIKLHMARDPLGIRPIFVGEDENGIAFCSEMKGLLKIVDPKTIRQLQGGVYQSFILSKSSQNIIHVETNAQKYFDISRLVPKQIDDLDIKHIISDPKMEPIYKGIRDCLEKCVIDRLESDRPIGFLLSGGLDSSLVVSIAAKHLKQFGQKLRTFSIGMPGATDRQYAEMVAKHCDTLHTHIEFTTEDFLNALNDVIKVTETFDITTVRASTGQYLVSKWINENTDIKVVFIGDGSDELCAGYMYFHNAPTPLESHLENVRLLKDIPYFDVLRADRGIAENGIEARVPYLDHRFVSHYLQLDPRIRVPQFGMEKWLLRKSFHTFNDRNDGDYLPHDVLYRKKEAFSDGVSGTHKSWYQIIQEKANTLYSDFELETFQKKCTHLPPPTKEAMYFRIKFNEMFDKDADHVIPYFWLPKWCGDIKEPSARVLDVYKQTEFVLKEEVLKSGPFKVKGKDHKQKDDVHSIL